MAGSRRSILRVVGYSLAAITIAVLAPLLAGMGRRTSGWARGMASDLSSNWLTAVLRIFGMDGPPSHLGEPGHLLDDLLGAAISATNRKP